MLFVETAKLCLRLLYFFQCQYTNSPHWYPYILLSHLLGEFVKDHSNFYLVIMSLILITFSLDLRIDTVRRDLMLVTVGLLGLKDQPEQVARTYAPKEGMTCAHRHHL